MEDKLTIVKIGGNLIDDKKVLDQVLKTFASIKGKKVLIHGGGKLASQLSRELLLPVEIKNGRRITTKKNLDVVTMVYAGLINKTIVSSLSSHGCPALGLSGADGDSIIAKKRPVKPIDYGYVGDIQSVNDGLIKQLLSSNLTPVFCAISHDKNGQLLNTNADTMAAEIAISLSNHYDVSLFYCLDRLGVLGDAKKEDSLIPEITEEYFIQLQKDKVIKDGMIPKLENCFYARKKNVSQIKIGKSTIMNDSKFPCTTIKL